jgi:hypothetical protein
MTVGIAAGAAIPLALISMCCCCLVAAAAIAFRRRRNEEEEEEEEREDSDVENGAGVPEPGPVLTSAINNTNLFSATHTFTNQLFAGTDQNLETTW